MRGRRGARGGRMGARLEAEKRKRDGAAPRTTTPPPRGRRRPTPDSNPQTSGPPPPFALPPPERHSPSASRRWPGSCARRAKVRQVTRAKQRGNPEFAFLDPGGEGNEYYAWLRHAARVGIDPKKPPGRRRERRSTPSRSPRRRGRSPKRRRRRSSKRKGGATRRKGRSRRRSRKGAQQEGAKARVGPWQAVKDSSGRTYYWNRDTQATTCTPPTDLTGFDRT